MPSSGAGMAVAESASLGDAAGFVRHARMKNLDRQMHPYVRDSRWAAQASRSSFPLR